MPILFMILAAFIWGLSYVASKLALQEISPFTLLFLRYVVATIFLFPIFLTHPISLNKKLVKQGIHLSLLQAVLMFMHTNGLQTISASLSSFVTGFYIVFVLIIRFIITRKLPNAFDIITSLICLGGLGLLTNSFGVTDTLGVVYTFVSAFFIAIYIYVLDKYGSSETAFTLTFLQMLGLMTFSGCAMLVNISSFQFPTQLLTWCMIMFLGLGCSSLAYWLQATAQPKLGAFKVSIILMLEPVFATIFSYFSLGEKLYPMSFLGIGIILTTVAIINWRLKEG